MHAKCAENLRQRELKLFFFKFQCKVLFSSLRPAVPNERLFVDDAVSRLFGGHIPSIKITPENAVKSVSYPLRQRKAYIYTAKGGYLKTTFVCKFCPSEPSLHHGLCF